MGATAMVIATVVSAGMQYKAGQDQKKVGKQNADRMRAESAEEARRMADAQESQLSDAKARASATGLATTGSQLGFLETLETKQKSELDWAKNSGASAASIAQKTSDIQSSTTKAGSLSTLVSGGGTAYNYWKR
jgi:hypothetical protein